MRRHRLILPFITIASVLAGCSEPPTAPEAPLAGPTASVARGDFQAPARHLVVFRGRAPADFSARVTELGGTVTLNHELGIAVVAGLSDARASTLRERVRAEYVETMPEFQLVDPAAKGRPVALSPGAAGAAVTSVENPAGALLFSEQWNMRQINADDAWAAGRLGDPDVTVAILDTGIDYLLPDLEGLVDLDRSISFEPVDDYYTNLYFPGRHPSTDLHFHGTNVATQVSSKAWAFAGVTSKTTLMSVKVCSVVGGCHGVLEGILYAIDNGADVINMSLGGWFSKAAYPGSVSAFNTLMNYAKQRGVTIVVAAGNDSIDLDRQDNVPITDDDGNVIDRVHAPSFFATYCDATQVICVSATRMNDVPASYTNYGHSAIDVAAPGGDSGEWVYSLCSQTSLLFDCSGGYFVLGVAGTSQATPHVSGLAALAVEDVGRNPAQVGEYIR
ncbi:MAG: S8 family serine peptidase, partial [Gemmatimonadaceae bacterium]